MVIPALGQTQRARGASGFSLIELMVVVAIIGIIASIALPSYNEHMRKTRRAAGGACVLAVAQQMERFYTANMTYTGAVADTAICRDSALDHYDIAVVANGRNYTISATPKGAQASDSCGTLGVSETGSKTGSGTSCW